MSEEKRFTNKKLIVVSIILVLVSGMTGMLGFMLVGVLNDNTNLHGHYDDLYIDYLELQYDFNQLSETYLILTGEYIELENDYSDLLDDYNTLQNNYDALLLAYENLLNDYNTLQIAYDSICNTIKQTILPVQYSIFAEAVRRYYMPIYLSDGLTTKEWYMKYAEFCRDIVLHDSYQYNAFFEVSNAFSDALEFGSNTMYLADYIMDYTFDYCNTIDYWGLEELSGYDEFTIIHNVVQQCIDNIDYEYDSDIIIGQDNPTWDYPKFPVETAFRTLGDCEDQAILTAAYLESCGIETAINIFHDPAHPTLGAFYHGTLMVHIEDTDAFYSMFPNGILLAFPEIDPYYPPDFTWCFLDTTWDVPFGSIPLWLQDYIDIGEITEDIVSDAICDINGGID